MESSGGGLLTVLAALGFLFGRELWRRLRKKQVRQHRR